MEAADTVISSEAHGYLQRFHNAHEQQQHPFRNPKLDLRVPLQVTIPPHIQNRREEMT
jgi:hypothetical protein